jgi:hypothetical protein
MKRFIAFLLAMWPALALADATVPSLAPATSLFGASTYLAQTGAANNQLGFLTSTFCLNSGALTICPSAISGSMLGPGAALSNIGAGSISSSYLAPTGVTPGSYTNLNATIGADGRITGASNGSGGGGGGTPGGSNGQVQYNNSGAFGGFTFSGGVTVNPSTGVAVLGNPGPSTLGGIESVAQVGGEFVQYIDTSGVPHLATPSGGGNVTGPGSSVNNDLACFNGTSGTLLADCGILSTNVVTPTSTNTLTNKSISAPEVNSGNLAAAQMSANLSAAIDAAVGSTQGDIAYRNATVWTVLPPGTTGQFLETQGASANPLWGTPSGSGNMTGSGAATTGDVICGNNTSTPLNTAVDCGFAPNAVDDPTTTGIFTAAQWNNGDELVVTTASQTLTAPASSTLARNGNVFIHSIAASTLAANAADTITYWNGSAVTTTSTGGSISLGAGALVQVTSKVSGNLKVAGNITGGGSSAFSALTGSTNTTAAMVVGSGATLGFSGSGTIAATSAPVSGLTGVGTGVLTALGVNVGSAGAFVVNGGALGTPSSGTLTNATGLPAASVLAGALANGMTGTTQTVGDNTTKLATDAFVIANTGGAVSITSLTPNLVLSPSTITGTGTIASTSPTTDQSGGSTAIVTGYNTELVYVGGGFTYTLAQAGTTGFTSGWGTCLLNTAASGNATITATTSTFKGASNTTSLTLAPGDWSCPTSDGTNYATAVGHYAGGGGSVSVTAGTPNIVITPSPGTGTFTVGATAAASAHSGNASTYTYQSSDIATTVNRGYTGGAMADTLPNVSASGFGAGASLSVCNISASQNDVITVNAPSTIGGASSVTVGPNTCMAIADTDGTNYTVPAAAPTISGLVNGQLAIASGTASLGSSVAYSNSGTASDVVQATSGGVIVNSLINFSQEKSAGWPAGVNPNNIVVFTAAQAETVTAIVGRNEVTVGATATLTVNKAPSGTPCASGTAISSSFNANTSATTNQSIISGTPTLAAGDSVCFQTTGGSNWGSGTGIGTITISVKPS